MDIFKGFTKEEPEKTVVGVLNIDTNSWFQVFSACLGKMMAIQNACGEIVVKGQNWNVDFTEGIICFGSSKFPLQFIGSESAVSNTWLWGWNNINGFSEKILSVAQQTKEIGEKWSLEPLTIPSFSLDNIFNGHKLSIVTCGLLEKYCYYRGPHSSGAIFIAFSDVPKEVFAPIDITRFTSLTTQCIQQFHIDHKIFVESLLLWNNTAYEWTDHTIIAHFQQDLYIKFEQIDGFLRICSMKTK